MNTTSQKLGHFVLSRSKAYGSGAHDNDTVFWLIVVVSVVGLLAIKIRAYNRKPAIVLTKKHIVVVPTREIGLHDLVSDDVCLRMRYHSLRVK